jgi:hypothetical protein
MSMTPSPATPLDGQPENPESNEINWIGWIIVIIGVFIVSQWEGWQQSHQRRARLDAYCRRHQWRKADVSRLLNLGIPKQRIERIISDNKRRGRGVVQNYQPLDTMLMHAAEQFSTLLSPDTPPPARLKVLKQTPVWSYVVEALYRGEHAAAKEACQKSPSMHAELLVADCLGITDSQVHKLCGGVRKERRCENKPSESESTLRIQEFEAWMKSGDLQFS